MNVKKRQTLIFLLKYLASMDINNNYYYCFMKAIDHICYRFLGVIVSLGMFGEQEKKLENILLLGSIPNREVL